MKTNSLRIILYGITIISIAMAISTTAIGQSDSRPPMPVEVKNTTPIPVSGSVTVASSPSAPLSVTGNVNVSGQVSVANVANSPLTVRDVNSVAKKPIQLSGTCSIGNNLGCPLVEYIVPTGKLLAIEYVSTRYGGPTGSRGKVVILTCMQENSYYCTGSSGGPHPTTIDRRTAHYLDATGVMSSGGWSWSLNHVATSQKVLIFGNDKASVTVYGHCNPGLTCSDEFTMEVTMSGYLIDNP